MQAQVEEVGADVAEQRPLAGGIGHHQGHPVFAQQLDERRVDEALMADFHGMPQALRRIAVEVALAVQARGAVPGELLRGGAVARQAGEEIGEQLAVEAHARRELPEERAEALAQGEGAGGEEVRQRLVDLAQAPHVGDVTRGLDAENEVLGGVLGPAAEALGRLQA